MPKKSVEIADGIPIKKITNVEVQTAFFLLQFSLSIKEDTGTSINEIEEVIAAIKANPKKTAAINLPNNPRFANPVGRAINKVPTVTEQVAVQDVLTLAYAINKVVNLRYFTFSAMVYGKYQDYEEDFDYDFTDDIKMVLQDRLSFDLKLGGK